jgi:hypothetical protein
MFLKYIIIIIIIILRTPLTMTKIRFHINCQSKGAGGGGGGRPNQKKGCQPDSADIRKNLAGPLPGKLRAVSILCFNARLRYFYRNGCCYISIYNLLDP